MSSCAAGGRGLASLRDVRVRDSRRTARISPWRSGGMALTRASNITSSSAAAANGRGPLSNLVVSELPVEERYSYVFEGNSQALDHMLLSPALMQAAVPGTFDIVHVNAEYADQVTDHDPLLARFLLVTP